ncbi:MAG: cytochrome d ubiquinol oxidase subunit II [Halobacteriaceae archaeon]
MTDLGTLSSGPLLGLPLADIWFALLFFILGMFLFLDGFDFGIGVLFATRDDQEDRERFLSVIGPFWDGNEVWLVVFGGALFAAFPAVYANLFSRHYLLMFAILAALGLRGLAPEMYEQRDDDRWHRAWGLAFVIGSAGAPLLLGTFVMNWVLGATALLTPTSIIGATAILALAIVDGAAFLCLKTRGDLRDEMRGRGIRAAITYLGLVLLTIATIYATEPGFRESLQSPIAIGLVGVTGLAVGSHVLAMRRERYHAAFAAVAILVFDLVGLLAFLMFPVIDRVTRLTIEEAIIAPLSLNLMTIMAAGLIPIVLGYFVVLYSVFGGPIEAGETY